MFNQAQEGTDMANVILLPNSGYLRLAHILGDSRADPPISPIIPVSKSTWWAGVKEGRFPKPVKLGPSITAWRVEDIAILMERIERGVVSQPLEIHNANRSSVRTNSPQGTPEGGLNRHEVQPYSMTKRFTI